jgi:NADPH:quinone reductase-like Zn-dependent oxidoreductase
MMKAIVYSEYGAPEVLRLADVETPMPKDNEIQVRVRATSVTVGDLWARNFKAISPREFSMPFPLWLPSRMFLAYPSRAFPVLGSEFAGVVESVGKDVKKFKKGDAVFGYRGQIMGANAEYLCISENGMVTHKPVNMTYEEAAAVPYGALTALSLLRKVNVQAGQKVLGHRRQRIDRVGRGAACQTFWRGGNWRVQCSGDWIL